MVCSARERFHHATHSPLPQPRGGALRAEHAGGGQRLVFGLDERVLYMFIIAACSLLLLTIITGFVRDMQRQASVDLRPAMSG